MTSLPLTGQGAYDEGWNGIRLLERESFESRQ